MNWRAARRTVTPSRRASRNAGTARIIRKPCAPWRKNANPCFSENNMQLSLCTWPEMDAYLTRSKGVIVPVGSTEQHGPTGLIGTDTISVETDCAARRRGGEYSGRPGLSRGRRRPPYGLCGIHEPAARKPSLPPCANGPLRSISMAFAKFIFSTAMAAISRR